jgi:hypothetical protein
MEDTWATLGTMSVGGGATLAHASARLDKVPAVLDALGLELRTMARKLAR